MMRLSQPAPSESTSPPEPAPTKAATPEGLAGLIGRVEDLEEKVNQMYKTIYGLYGLQETVNRLDIGGND
jgi:hypothetical protein